MPVGNDEHTWHYTVTVTGPTATELLGPPANHNPAVPDRHYRPATPSPFHCLWCCDDGCLYCSF